MSKSHLVGQLLNSIHDARTHVYKNRLIVFDNWGGGCLLRGTAWVFKYISSWKGWFPLILVGRSFVLPDLWIASCLLTNLTDSLKLGLFTVETLCWWFVGCWASLQVSLQSVCVCVVVKWRKVHVTDAGTVFRLEEWDRFSRRGLTQPATYRGYFLNGSNAIINLVTKTYRVCTARSANRSYLQCDNSSHSTVLQENHW